MEDLEDVAARKQQRSEDTDSLSSTAPMAPVPSPPKSVREAYRDLLATVFGTIVILFVFALLILAGLRLLADMFGLSVLSHYLSKILDVCIAPFGIWYLWAALVGTLGAILIIVHGVWCAIRALLRRR
jgi:hypothetical protein